MPPLLSEGLNLVVRWAHLIAGIMWIGSSIFFHWLDSHMEKPPTEPASSKKGGLEGVLWMVHSGGFYEVEKKLVAPGELPKTLHWFRWEAAFTWMTGFFLLVLVYHLGGGVLLVDGAHPVVSHEVATALCFGTMIAAWFAYDALWMSKLAGEANKNPPVTVAISVVTLAAIALVFTHFLSGRAAYIHTAAVMGTCMVLNVWVRIIPAQRNLVESVRAGTAPNAAMAYSAKRRSKHNHYMTYPVLFIMISNHFPSTYGASSAALNMGSWSIGWNWVALVVLCALGAAVKLWLNIKEPGAMVGVAALVVLAVVAAGGTGYASMRSTEPQGSVTSTTGGAPTASEGRAIAASGRIKGVVTWTGAVPPARDVALYGGCEQGHDGPLSIPSAIVHDGKLAEAFVAVTGGVDGYAIPAAQGDVVVEQHGCLYSPRVSAARVGQNVAFVNQDPIFHNVRSVSSTNETFALNQPAQGQRDVKVFRAPEIMVETRCDIHPWMVSHIGVVANPWFAVTKDDGAFVLDGVPAGDVELTFWSDAGGVKKQHVIVPASGEALVDVSFGAKP
jgi:uncharacterized membrane protein/plastocyanin